MSFAFSIVFKYVKRLIIFVFKIQLYILKYFPSFFVFLFKLCDFFLCLFLDYEVLELTLFLIIRIILLEAGYDFLHRLNLSGSLILNCLHLCDLCCQCACNLFSFLNLFKFSERLLFDLGHLRLLWFKCSLWRCFVKVFELANLDSFGLLCRGNLFWFKFVSNLELILDIINVYYCSLLRVNNLIKFLSKTSFNQFISCVTDASIVLEPSVSWLVLFFLKFLLGSLLRWCCKYYIVSALLFLW